MVCLSPVGYGSLLLPRLFIAEILMNIIEYSYDEKNSFTALCVRIMCFDAHVT